MRKPALDQQLRLTISRDSSREPAQVAAFQPFRRRSKAWPTLDSSKAGITLAEVTHRSDTRLSLDSNGRTAGSLDPTIYVSTKTA